MQHGAHSGHTVKAEPVKLGMIGFGAIGRSIVAEFQRVPVPGYDLAMVCVRPHQLAEARELLPAAIKIVAAPDAMLDAGLGLVIEAASQAAVFETGARLIAAGIDLYVLSTGALADESLRASLQEAAHTSGARVAVPAGALAGFRALLSMRQAGLNSVVYTSTKPPLAWVGTPAEQAFDLAGLTAPAVVFDGSAADAALTFPRNANLAAAVALAGLGFERTVVRLVADPSTDENSGRIQAEGAVGRLDLTLSGRAAASNPKTSEITGMSVLAALRNSAGPIVFV